MKNKLYYRLSIALLFISVFYTRTEAQKVLTTVVGSSIVSTLPGSAGGGQFTVSGNCLYFQPGSWVVLVLNGGWIQEPKEQLFCPGEIIINMTVCIINNQAVITLLLANGATVVYSYASHTSIINPAVPSVGGSQPPQKITGDALYTMSYNYVYKSTDHGATWTIDTAGLNGVFLHSICTDTFQKVYLATNNGLFTQTANGATWVKNTNYPAAYCSFEYTDRRNRLFPLANMLYMSADTGASFQPDTAGLPQGGANISSMGDDIYGNIYAIINYKQIYRSTGGTQPFVRIDQQLTALNNDLLYAYLKPFNRISGDSILFAATAYGSFYSLDQGNTWHDNNKGISAVYFFGLARAGNGKMITTTDLGCFSSTDANDTLWTKVYPDTGYCGGQPLYKANNGTLYTRGGTLYSDMNFQTRMVVKSTDNGATWLPDTLGISQMIMATWFVDETGTQHAAQWGGYAGPTKLFSKSPGLSWTTDNAGFSGDSALPIAFGTNGAGKIYYSDGLLRSKQGAGNWMLDTAGLMNAGGVYDFAHSSSGTMYLGGYMGIWKQTGSTWTQLNNPSTVSYTSSAFAIAVDASNAVWAAFSYFDVYYNSIGLGVFYTTDDGATWHQPSFQIDTITFLKLVAIGDSVYGLSYYNGAYLFDKNGSSSVSAVSANDLGVSLFPNPAQGTCTLRLTGNPEVSSASIYDIAGMEVLPLISNQRVSSFNFSTQALSPGMYYIKVSDDMGHVAVCKLIKE